MCQWWANRMMDNRKGLSLTPSYPLSSNQGVENSPFSCFSQMAGYWRKPVDWRSSDAKPTAAYYPQIGERRWVNRWLSLSQTARDNRRLRMWLVEPFPAREITKNSILAFATVNTFSGWCHVGCSSYDVTEHSDHWRTDGEFYCRAAEIPTN